VDAAEHLARCRPLRFATLSAFSTWDCWADISWPRPQELVLGAAEPDAVVAVAAQPDVRFERQASAAPAQPDVRFERQAAAKALRLAARHVAAAQPGAVPALVTLEPASVTGQRD
jgi:hypothetical protein